MAIRTEGVGTARALQFWDQYGVKKYDFLPSEMVTPGPVLFEFEKLLLSDTDVTPVGAVLLKVLDQALLLRNAADDGDTPLHSLLLKDIDATPVGNVLLHVKDQVLEIKKPDGVTDVILPEGNIPHTLNDPLTLGADLDLTGHDVKRVDTLLGDASLFISANLSANVLRMDGGITAEDPALFIYGKDHAGNPGELAFYSPNTAKDTLLARFIITGAADVSDITWSNILHESLKLKDALDANSQKITNLLDPTAAQDGATKAYVDGEITTLDGLVIKKDGSVTFTANQPMGGFKLTGLGAPTDPNDAARLIDVATAGGGAYGTAGDVTVAAGAITITGHHYKVDAAGATDLNTVTAGAGVAEGWMVVLRAKNIANPITCKDGVGNLRLQSDFTLDSLEDSIMIIYDGANWLEVARSNNS